ncbi:JAB domain-containing protein [Flagellimonas meridianipacifica]|uniref:RadC-like JAB domain-containing protein n=1 Tax=Flagellimonas meridianipacifica TaxID=1080225 RepID=A0A2T0M8Z1_9FLAO|nr:JAB domain-containing protein [Allomuricauda pacifica]PRX53950.1 RadC-like JAB domain-containing protein [Allomuricauda pacifica]
MRSKVSEIKVSYSEKIPVRLRYKVNSSQAVAEVLYRYWDRETIQLNETFKVVLLNNGNRIKGIYEVSKGGITGTMVDLRILFAVILKSLSVAIILAHNHPSGTLRASKADEDLTHKIKRAAELFDVKVLDHILLAPNGNYYSFADNGLL